MSDESTDETDETDETVALRRERDRLRAELDATRRDRNTRRRRVLSGIVVLLSVLTFAAAVPGAWAKRTVLDTDRYVATVSPLASDSAIQEYIARTVTMQVFQALDVEQRLSDVLSERNERLAFLAGPITNAVQGFGSTSIPFCL